MIENSQIVITAWDEEIMFGFVKCVEMVIKCAIISYYEGGSNFE